MTQHLRTLSLQNIWKFTRVCQTWEKKNILFLEIFLFVYRKRKKIKLCENYYFSVSTPPRDTAPMSFEKGNNLLEHQRQFFFSI